MGSGPPPPALLLSGRMGGRGARGSIAGKQNRQTGKSEGGGRGEGRDRRQSGCVGEGRGRRDGGHGKGSKMMDKSIGVRKGRRRQALGISTGYTGGVSKRSNWRHNKGKGGDGRLQGMGGVKFG